MSMNVEWWTEDGVVVTWRGAVSAEDLIQMISNSYPSETIAKLKYVVMDFSAIEEPSLTLSQMNRISDATKAATTNGVLRRFAALVAPQDLIFGHSRQWEGLVGDQSKRDGVFSVFRTREEAESWINDCMSATYGKESAPFGSVE